MLLALVAAGGLAAQAATPCPPRDKECLLKTIKASPVLSSSYWTAPLGKPLLDRIGTAPPEVVEYLQLDVALNDFPNKPRAAAADPAFLADVRRAFDGIPAPVKKLLETKLGGILFAEDIGGTGFTEATADEKLGFVVLDSTVLAKQAANAWATW